MKIEILGTGCPKCRALKANTKIAAESLGCDYLIDEVTSIDEITRRGVLMTPALVLDGKVRLQGRSGTPDQIRKILETESVALLNRSDSSRPGHEEKGGGTPAQEVSGSPEGPAEKS